MLGPHGGLTAKFLGFLGMKALKEQARKRAGSTGTGIGAAFERDVGPPDLDGFRWRFWVSDGTRAGSLEAQISGSEPILHDEIPVAALERVVERQAGRFPTEDRLSELLSQERIQIRSDDFRDQDFEVDQSL
jgi:hypothetical protein